MNLIRSVFIVLCLGILTYGVAYGLTQESFDVRNPKVQEINKKCITCHLKENKSLVFQWAAGNQPVLVGLAKRQ